MNTFTQHKDRWSTKNTYTHDLVLPALLYNSDLGKFAAKLDDSQKKLLNSLTCHELTQLS